MRRVLDELLRNLGIEKRVKEQMAIALWPQAVGERIAQVSTPVRIRDGILFVRVASSTWRNELVFHKREILKRVNEAVGKAVIEDIRFQ
ncbi:MAG: DUF721 domain-containing protein [bacterium]|jgi:predicted nucleic acid-binding Zn ribbon protein|nr:DUF721 domain-containing protein [candidate division KSB1 bacterium]MDH7561202.1 DUF721 domain-containing protein [bacterium]